MRRLPAIVAVALALLAGGSWRLARAEAGTSTHPLLAKTPRPHQGRLAPPFAPARPSATDRDEIAWEWDENDEEDASASFDWAVGRVSPDFPRPPSTLRAGVRDEDRRAPRLLPSRPLRC